MTQRHLPWSVLLLASVSAQDDPGARAAALLDRMDAIRLGGATAGTDRSRVAIAGRYDLVVGGPQEIRLQGPYALWIDGDRCVQEVDYGEWGKMLRGHDAELAWEEHPAFGNTVYRGIDADVMRRCTAFTHYHGWRMHYGSAVVDGDDTIDGRKQHKLTLTPKAGGRPDVWWLDVATGLPTRIDMVLPATTAMGTMRMSYSDWRPVDGILFAHVERGTAGQGTGTFTVASIRHGATIAAERMAIPDKIKTMIANGTTGIEGCRCSVARAQPVASIRLQTTAREIQKQLAIALPEVMTFLVAAGVESAGPPFTRYHAFELGDGRMDVECGIPVAAPIRGKGRVQASELPGGRVATTWHVGSYHELGNSYQRLKAWIGEQQLEVAGAPWEVYWTDPGLEKDPARWRTQIAWPLTPAKAGAGK